MVQPTTQHYQAKSNDSNSRNAFDTRSKFTLYNLLGEEEAYYLVDKFQIKTHVTNIFKKASHHIIIIDRSASMQNDIEVLKESLIKFFTLDNFFNSQLLFTLVSYSSWGDLICHFHRTSIQEILQQSFFYAKKIQKIRAATSTCISQAMQLASSLIQKEELTAITLLSDGYANDINAHLEAKAIEKTCQKIKTMNVFVNTIAYSDDADFKTLAKIAHTVSGFCFKANDAREVYNILHHTSQLLENSSTLSIEEPLEQNYNYQVFVSSTASKLNGSSDSLKILGFRASDKGVFYKYQSLDKDLYQALTNVPISQTDESVFAFAKAKLIEGKLDTAKCALASTFNATLTKQHANALTNKQIAALAQDLDLTIFKSVLQVHDTGSYTENIQKFSILEIVSILNEYKNGIVINIKELEKNYPEPNQSANTGESESSGLIEYQSNSDYAAVEAFEVSRNTATINLTIKKKVKLVVKKAMLVSDDNNTQVAEISGVIGENLYNYNKYALVSDSKLSVESLKVHINSKKVFDLLKEKNVIEKDGTIVQQFDFRTEYTLRLDTLALVPIGIRYDNIGQVFNEIAQIQVLSNIVSSHLQEIADIHVPVQDVELNKLYFSPNLYVNFLQKPDNHILEQPKFSKIDAPLSYRIDIGSKDILNISQLSSAHQFLNKMYEAYNWRTGEVLSEAFFDMSRSDSIAFRHKKLLYLTKVDELMKPIYDDLLAIEDNGIVASILSHACEYNLIHILQNIWNNQAVDTQELVTALKTAKNRLEQYLERIYTNNISPLVFYTCSTGVLPDKVEAIAHTSKEIASKYTNLQFSEEEKDGVFFEFGNSIISLYAENKHCSKQESKVSRLCDAIVGNR